jgi:hypothetical protein
MTKQIIIKLVLTTLFLAASTGISLSFSGPGQPPLCYPGSAECPR